ncbi:hypothetical protein LUQ84_3464 [Hamiltosporidium tvaerminnensis]|nr:hypothetical protein LUQ84_3464 [Hamiltosporidium tvaerminnensis]
MGRKERENEKLKEKRKKRQKRAEIFEMLLEISKKQEKNNITVTKSSKDNKLHFLNKENIQKNKVKKSKVTGIDDKKSDITDKHIKKSEIFDLNLKNKNQKKIISDKIIFSSTEQTLSSSKKRITDDSNSEENCNTLLFPQIASTSKKRITDDSNSNENSNNSDQQEDSTLQRSITDDSNSNENSNNANKQETSTSKISIMNESNSIKNSNSIKKYFGVEDFQNTNSKTNIKDLNFFRKQYDEENKKLIEKIFKKVEFSSEESKNTFLNLRTNEIQDFRKTLPIFYEESQIVSNVKSNIITIIKGETGCGKTTQVAQFLYESGFSTNKKIGMTQPRRLAAISLSERINLEMNINICNYKIRYENTCNKNTKIKIMTDGILLKEIMKDFLLKDYSVIILDEIHERSINTDVLISLLIKIALYREKTEEKLKIIFMSATFDENIVFSLVEDILKKDKIEFENINSFISSIVIESRNYSVDIFYESTDPNNILESVLLRLKKILKMSLKNENCMNDFKKFNLIKKYKNVVLEKDYLFDKNVRNDDSSGILIFLSSKREIYQLKKMIELEDLELIVLPLHSSLPYSEQKKVFQPYDRRKVVLSTNIAETSITVSDIVFVIDCGKSKVFLNDDKNILRYEIVNVSKSSADQRTGRAGRCSHGVCYRMYTRQSFNTFEEYNTPSILTSSLFETILNLKKIGIENIFNFPFLTFPPQNKINFALNSLKSLNLLDSNNKITKIGKKVLKIPVHPKVARILYFKEAKDILHEIILIISFLSVLKEWDLNDKDYSFVSENINQLFIDELDFTEKYINFILENEIVVKYAIIYLIFTKKCEHFDSFISTKTRDIYKIAFSISKEFKIDFCLNQLTLKNVEIIRKVIYHGFIDNLVIRSGNRFYFGEEEVFFGNKNCKNTLNNFFVFEYLIKGKEKYFMKNVTVVDEKWI